MILIQRRPIFVPLNHIGRILPTSRVVTRELHENLGFCIYPFKKSEWQDPVDLI